MEKTAREVIKDTIGISVEKLPLNNKTMENKNIKDITDHGN